MKKIVQQKIYALKNMSRQNKICIMVLFIQILSFYFMIANMGFGTHDEIYQYITHTNPEWEFNTNFSGRFMPVIGQVLMFLQFNAPTVAIYRIYTMVGMLLGLGAAMLFVKHHVSEKDWLKYAIVFLAFLQIQDMHSGAVAFDMTYQYRMFYCFMFLDLYLLFCKTEKKRYYISSTIFWCIAINSYEAYYTLAIILFLLASVVLIEKKQFSFKKIVQYLWLPATVAAISLIVYVIRIGVSGASYSGATISTSYGMVQKIKSILIYTLGNWPLRLNNYSFVEILKKILVVNYENLFIVFKNLLIAVVISKGIENKQINSMKKWGVAISMSVVGAVLIAALVGMTQQYCSWAFESGVCAAGISYYSYFFIVIFIVLVFGKINEISNKKWLKCIKVILFVCVFFTGITTEINNIEAAESVNKRDNKYELFDEVVKSDYFASIDEGAVIYAPEMLGVHYNLAYLDIYCKQNYEKNVTFRNQLSEVDFNAEVYMMHYISESEVMLFGKVEDEKLQTEEVYMVGLNDFSEYSIYFERDVEESGTSVTINEYVVGVYANTVSIPLRDSVSGTSILIKTEVIPMEEISILKGTITDNAILWFEFGKGVYQQEDFGRWIATESNYTINYEGYEECIGTIHLMLSTATGEAGNISIEVDGKTLVYEVDETPTPIEIETRLKHGENCISIISEVPSLETVDVRDINLRLSEAYGVFEEELYRFY